MTLLNEAASGVYVIAVTPFADNGALDLDSADRMMGEAPKLTADESRVLVRRVLARTAGRVPVVVGVSGPGLAAMGELAKAVMDDGAAGVMVAPPGSLRTDDQIVAYYDMVAEAIGTGTPLVLQDFPQSTGVQISPAVILKIVARLPNMVMLKHEDWPGLAKLAAIRVASESGTARRISILVGNGGVFLPEELSRGADGAMTGFAYPEMMVDVWRAHAAGDVERAHDLFDAYLPLARYEQQPGPGLAIRKYILAKRGVIASAALRKPGAALSAADIADVERLISRQTRRLQELG
jgi:4-hydroxy-tetrahydrodipicolinate synthase